MIEQQYIEKLEAFARDHWLATGQLGSLIREYWCVACNSEPTTIREKIQHREGCVIPHAVPRVGEWVKRVAEDFDEAFRVIGERPELPSRAEAELALARQHNHATHMEWYDCYVCNPRRPGIDD